MSGQIYYTYMLKCWKSQESFDKNRPIHGHIIYTGYTNNIMRRLREHLTGKRYGKRPTYTSSFHGLIELGYLEAYTTKNEAMTRESEIKTFSRDKKIKMMQDRLDDEKYIINEINRKVVESLIITKKD